MPRNSAAYLCDIIAACDAIDEVLDGVELSTYCAKRPIRSAVEREFTIIGEAITVLSRRDPALARRITHSRLIVGFRNRLVHEYPQIDAEAVYAIAQHDTSILRKECGLLLQEVDESAP
jgi:uncharacterized protein with HEPN domain